MAQTVANLTDVLKEAWTSDVLEKQFYDENPFLTRLEKFEATTIGEKAIVPIHAGRSGGYTSANAAGGSLNAAGNQRVDAAEYTLVYHWFQVQIEAAALAQAAGGDSSIPVAKDLELQGAIADTRKQVMRQVVTNSDGILAACDTGGASATVELLVDSATSYGAQAIKRGWLYAGQTIDIGATTNTDSIVGGAVIQSVTYSQSDPDIVIDSSVSTVSGTDFVFIANPNSGTNANPEVNGLRSMVGSASSALGGLDPDNAGEEYWQPAKVDTTTTVLSLDLLLDLQLEVQQRSGKDNTLNLCGLKQRRNLYALLQNQVRFASDAVSAGSTGSIHWNGMEVVAQPDVLDTDFFMLTESDICRIVPKGISKPTWATDLSGEGGALQYAAGTTAFKNSVCFPLQVGLKRRNTHAAALGLTA